MTESANQRPELDHGVALQVAVIVDAFEAEGIAIGTEVEDDGGVDFMYQKGHILVRDQDAERVWEIVRLPEDNRQRQERGDEFQRVITGVLLLSLAATRFSGDNGVLDALDEIDSAFGRGVATPNHVLTVAPVGPCPATEPQEVTAGIEPEPGVCPGDDGEGVFVYVADTGLLAGAAQTHSWLAGVHGDVDPLPDPSAIPAYTGHGTFVAGVARCMAPKAHMYVANIFKIAGSELESNAVARLGSALDLGVDVFHLSITAATRFDLPLKSFQGWREQLREYKGVVCVVAAGNSSTRKPTWPSAFPEMVSVGALAADWRTRATFTNHGGWVDVYAPGRDLVNAYATGTYTCNDLPYVGQVRNFYGMARWSGTSFSTPIVTGLIAARMSRSGENGQEAAAALLAKARSNAIPGVGAVLLPCETGDGHCHPVSHCDHARNPAGCCQHAHHGCGH
jgi:hypothetical protein